MTKSVDPVDRIVGANIRALRIQKGMSQGQLGEKIGVTFQQVQKYENGRNRIGASRLQKIAGILDVRPEAFFSGISNPASSVSAPITLLSDANAVRLLTAFSRIEDLRMRKALVELVETVSPSASV